MGKKKTTTKKLTPTKEIVALKAVLLYILAKLDYNGLLDKSEIQIQLDKLKEVGQFVYSEADYYENMGKDVPQEKAF